MINACIIQLKIAMRIPLLFLLAFGLPGLATVQGQTTPTSRLAGQIVNEKTGELLGGASLSINSLHNGALLGRGLSADDGTFSILCKTEDSVKVSINYVGYAARIFTTIIKQGVIIRLAPVSTELNSAVVIGYGRVKRKDLTGSVAQVKMDDILKAPVRSFDEALAGRVAGVQVTSSDGMPGADVNIVIRGANSITQDNSPLYVIDGFPIENPNNNVINPQDIESMEVLKDASSTAIYGARGANGVILITTKKGKSGAPTVSLNSSYGFQKSAKIIKLMSPADFVKYQLEFNPSTVPYVTGSGAAPTPYQLYMSGGTTPAYYQDTAASIDWQDAVLQTAPIQSHNLSITGGSDKTKYAISGNIFDQSGIVIASKYKRYQGRVVLDQTVDKRLKVGINANYSYLVQQGLSPNQSTNSGTTNLMYSVWGYRPVSPSIASQQAIGLIDVGTGGFTDPEVPSTQDYRFNPVTNLQNLVRNNFTKAISVNGYAEYLVADNLTLRITGGINGTTLRNEQFNNSSTSYGNSLITTNGPNGSVNYNEANSWLNENTLTYNRTIGTDHTINAVIGFTEQGNKTSSYGVSAIKVPNESLGINDLREGTPLAVTSTGSLWTASSFLGRVNYSFQSKYLLTAGFRADGSSKFAPQNHWAYFPSGAIAWRFTSEPFLKNQHILTDGKLRLSYGNTGNNRVSDFAYLATYSQSPTLSSVYTFNNVPVTGAVPATIGNPDLKWETTSQLNAGVDLSLLGDRISVTADVYRKKTKNLLLNANVPTSSGYTTVFMNIGSVQNQGLELAFNVTPIRKKDLTWNASFNIAFNQSKVLGLANGQTTLISTIRWDNNWQSAPAYIAQVGKPLGQMYGYVWDGVYQPNEFNKTTANGYTLIDNITTNGNSRSSIQPGDIKYKDLNDDKIVNAGDYTVIGRGLPVHIGGFNNNVTWKGFDVNVFFQWSYGNDIQNVNNMVFAGNALGKTYLNQFASYNNRWRPDYTNTDQFRTNGFYGGGYSSRTVEDGSYLRLKTVSLGYSLPKSWLQKAKFNSFRLYVSGQNLWTLTKYSGQDPEVNAYNSVLTAGFDYSPYPRARTIVFGANVSF